MKNLKLRVKNRGYPENTGERHLSDVNFTQRERSLKNENKEASSTILPLVTQYHPAVPNLKNVLMVKWHLVQNQPSLRNVFEQPPLLSYRIAKENS